MKVDVLSTTAVKRVVCTSRLTGSMTGAVLLPVVCTVLVSDNDVYHRQMYSFEKNWLIFQLHRSTM